MYNEFMQNTEIEVRFLEINKQELIAKLKQLGAADHGEELLEEIIFYDPKFDWLKTNQFVRLRQSRNGIFLTYKDHKVATATGTEEIEFKVGDMQKAQTFLERIGLVAERHQQKLRHSLELDGVIFDIDTWPKIPTYVELEGPSEQALKDAAKKVNLDWKDVVFENARIVIEQRYHIPVGSMKWFTFERFE
jgi:adenylate cyclase class 2